jgi:hypothetical protein
MNISFCFATIPIIDLSLPQMPKVRKQNYKFFFAREMILSPTFKIVAPIMTAERIAASQPQSKTASF